MEKEDFRTIEDTVRSSYRKRAINLIKKGVKKGEIAILFGVNKKLKENLENHIQMLTQSPERF